MKIKNLKQANDALYRVAEIEAMLKESEAARDEMINLANAEFSEKTAVLDEELEKLVSSLHAYTDEHRDEIFDADKKSVDLANGTLGYRLNPDKVVVGEKTADLLIAAGLSMMVKVKKEPVKASLKGMSDADLAKYDAKRIPGQESFFAKAAEIRRSVDPKPAA